MGNRVSRVFNYIKPFGFGGDKKNLTMKSKKISVVQKQEDTYILWTERTRRYKRNRNIADPVKGVRTKCYCNYHIREKLNRSEDQKTNQQSQKYSNRHLPS